MGNLIEDPELTKTRNDNYVAKMRVACSRRVQRQVDSGDVAQAQQNLANSGYNAEGNGTGSSSSSSVEWVDTDHFFIDVECWGQLAKNVKRSLIKGRPIMANGYMYTSSWEDKDGNKRSRPVLRATNVGMELSWFIAASKRSSADDEVLLDGVELPNGEVPVDTDLNDIPPADTQADATAAASSSSASSASSSVSPSSASSSSSASDSGEESLDSNFEAAAKAAEKESGQASSVKTTTKKQTTKAPNMPF